ncbi:EndoU domain-containing protein [Corynebacterium lizhenjunii]|uniref:EndoU domain-containing protein n=1 Tax=Corynebacterium lizhenjunii TaxID=2709394 RepID=A0A7T0KH48_9CORY|nr:EndoU domain-containing protein [Corynebacterium lizhenjunii]
MPEYAGDGTSKVFPGEPLPKDLNRAVAHVLYGWRDTPLKGGMWVKHSEDSRMGHTWDSQRAKASKFPKSWSNQKIADAVVETLENPEYFKSGKTRRTVWREIEGTIVKVEYNVIPGGRVIFGTAYPCELEKGADKHVD